MSDYRGAKYIGQDPIHLQDGSLILKDEVTKLLSEEAALNDNLFEPVYGEIKEKKAEKKTVTKKKYSFKRSK